MYRFAITALALWANSAMAQEYLLKPVDATCISSSFGPRTIRNHPEAGTFHFGLDFPAPEGSPVWAIEAGTLVKVQQNGPESLISYSRLAATLVAVGRILIVPI
jgi:murein DD-endopeptidase MepM/ murein hydrolase activator NlpD